MTQLDLLTYSPPADPAPAPAPAPATYPCCQLRDRHAWAFHTAKAAMLTRAMQVFMTNAAAVRESNPERFRSYQAQIQNAFLQREAALRLADQLAHEPWSPPDAR